MIDLNEYNVDNLKNNRDDRYTSKVAKILGKEYKNRIILYNFDKTICNKYKIHNIFEKYMSDETKKKLKSIADDKSEESYFEHIINKDPTDWVDPNQVEITKNTIDQDDLKDFHNFVLFSYNLAKTFSEINNSTFNIGHSIKSNYTITDMELIEFHTYILKNIQTPTKGDFSIHVDDEAGVNYKTITLIWYIHKNVEVDGGNISFYDQKGNEIFFDIFKKDDETVCKCLIFTGDINHAPQPLSGTGTRKCIVFQFKREENKSIKSRLKKILNFAYINANNVLSVLRRRITRRHNTVEVAVGKKQKKTKKTKKRKNKKRRKI